MTQEQAWTLLTRYNQEPFHIQHARTMQGIMRHMAALLGHGEEDFWGLVGLLHDLDYEQYPEEHCIRSQEIMREEGLPERLIRATACHGYGMTKCDLAPEHEMEKVLFATDELSGLIGAIVLMIPSKSIQDVKLSSVMKKFKTPKFAAGCSRDVIQRGADMLGWPLETLVERTLEVMKATAE